MYPPASTMRDSSGLPWNYVPVHPANTEFLPLSGNQQAYLSSHPTSRPIPPQFSAPAPTFQQAPPYGIPDWLDPIYVSGVFPPTPPAPLDCQESPQHAVRHEPTSAVGPHDPTSLHGPFAPPVPATQGYQQRLHHTQRAPSAHDVISQRVRDGHEGPPYPGPSYAPGLGSSTTTYRSHQRGEDPRAHSSQVIGRSVQAASFEASTIARGAHDASAASQRMQAPPEQNVPVSDEPVSYRCGIDGCETVLTNKTSQGHLRSLHYPVSDYPDRQRADCRYTGCGKDLASFCGLLTHCQRVHWQSCGETCPVCQVHLAHRTSLSRHWKTRHPELQPPYSGKSSTVKRVRHG
ncbi:hypothetical protein C2E23DRAFT_590308 [Lenzites betulinus]|nr:hypothetical protein C2E23DRAFT_590308 [Lenzites betulinus]